MGKKKWGGSSKRVRVLRDAFMNSKIVGSTWERVKIRRGGWKREDMAQNGEGVQKWVLRLENGCCVTKKGGGVLGARSGGGVRLPVTVDEYASNTQQNSKKRIEIC